MDFFAGYDYISLLGLLFAMFFGAIPGFNLFNWMKVRFGVDGAQANLMVMATSIVLTAVALFVTGETFGIESMSFTLANVLAFAGALYKASQYAHSRFTDSVIVRLIEGNVEGEYGEFPVN